MEKTKETTKDIEEKVTTKDIEEPIIDLRKTIRKNVQPAVVNNEKTKQHYESTANLNIPEKKEKQFEKIDGFYYM